MRHDGRTVSDSAAPACHHGRRVLVRSRRPLHRAAIGHRSSPGRIRASCGPRTRPPGGHPAGERRTRRRRNGRTDPRPPSGPAPRRRLVPRRLAADRTAVPLARRLDALADRLSRAGGGLGRDGRPFGARTLRVRGGSPRRSNSIRRRDRATRPGGDSFPSSRRYECLVGAAAARGRTRSGPHECGSRASHPADAGSGKRSRRRGHRAVDRRVPGVHDHRCTPLPRDGRYAAIEPGAGALDRPTDRHVQRDDCSRSLRGESGGRDGAVVEARRRDRRAALRAAVARMDRSRRLGLRIICTVGGPRASRRLVGPARPAL